MVDKRKEELEFGKQMDRSPDKQEVADLVVKYERTNVLDLGAGTGIISRLIAEHEIHCDAVDNNFKADVKDTKYIRYYSNDLIQFIKDRIKTDKTIAYYMANGSVLAKPLKKYDCIVLSAVLHELSKKDFNYLKKNLYKIMSDDCIIIIREPYYVKVKLCGGTYYLPYYSKQEQDLTIEEIENVTCPKFKELFRSTKKVSGRKVPYPIEVLNMAFTFSYGEASWEREVNEYRYTFSYKDLKKFCDAAYKYDHFILEEVKFDHSYKKYFNAYGYSDNVLQSIDYTNGLLIALPSKYEK